MTTSNIVDEWRLARAALIQRHVDKIGNYVTMKLTDAFGRLSADDREQLEPLLREWLLSDDFADRFDAIAIVRNNDVASMIPRFGSCRIGWRNPPRSVRLTSGRR